jgi:hypothetical protein
MYIEQTPINQGRKNPGCLLVMVIEFCMVATSTVDPQHGTFCMSSLWYLEF